MVVIEDYYPWTILDENMCWMKLTRLLVGFPQNLRAPFCESTFTEKFLMALLYVPPKKNNTFPLCILCTKIKKTLLTLTLVHTWYEESSPRLVSTQFWWIFEK